MSGMISKLIHVCSCEQNDTMLQCGANTNNKRGNYTEHSSIFGVAYGKHMFNIHLVKIMRFHVFAIIKELCVRSSKSNSWLMGRFGFGFDSGQITKIWIHTHTHTNTYAFSFIQMSIHEFNIMAKTRTRIVVTTIMRTLEAFLSSELSYIHWFLKELLAKCSLAAYCAPAHINLQANCIL